MPAPGTLNDVVAGVLRDVAKREAAVPFQDIKARSRDMAPTRDARAALLRHGCSVIVEIKRNSPVFGPTGAGYVPVEALARDIEAGGAHLIACQTERLRFDGSLADMAQARAAVELPMVCRDVIVDPYQIHEARCYGADAVPLQVGILEQARLVALLDRAESLGMAAVLEVRTPEEYMGDVIGDLNSRRGQIQSMEDATGVKVVNALVPLSEMFGYIGDLRSKTQGRAVYSMTFHSYAEVPKAVADEIIQKSQGE